MKSQKQIIILIIILLFTFGCTEQSVTDVVPTSKPSGTSIMITPTFQPTVKLSPTVTQTPTSTSTITVLVSPTVTPLPTLEYESLSDTLTNFIHTNDGCQLPCWWGMNPGETKWSEAIQYFEQLRAVIERSRWSLIGGDNLDTYRVSIWIPGSDDTMWLYFGVQDNIIHLIVADPGSVTIPISNLLTTYGKPKEILVVLENTYAEFDDKRYALFLKYEDQRILAEYTLSSTDKENPTMMCIQTHYTYGQGSPYLYLWSDDLELWHNENDLLAITNDHWRGAKQGTKVYSLEDISEFDTSLFYETFMQATNVPCLEISEP